MHPVYGRAARARVAVPAHTMLMQELPLLYGKPPARLDAVCDEVSATAGTRGVVAHPGSPSLGRCD